MNQAWIIQHSHKRKCVYMYRAESSNKKIHPHMYSQLIIYQGAKSSQRDREVFQTDGAGTTGKMYGIK